jgi:hypothetical protein
MSKEYTIVVRIEHEDVYVIEADTMDEAETEAINAAELDYNAAELDYDAFQVYVVSVEYEEDDAVESGIGE